MFKILLALMCVFSYGVFANEQHTAHKECAQNESFEEQHDFWPPDMIPHPTPPGSGPEWEEKPGPKEA